MVSQPLRKNVYKSPKLNINFFIPTTATTAATITTTDFFQHKTFQTDLDTITMVIFLLQNVLPVT